MRFKIEKPKVMTQTREHFEIENIIRFMLPKEWDTLPGEWKDQAVARIVFNTVQQMERSVNEEFDNWDEATRPDYLESDLPKPF